MIQAIMGWWQGVSFRPHHIEMIFDRMVAPLYGWLFPESDGVVNIGIAYEEEERGRQNARQLFQRFLDKHYRDRLKGCPQIGAFKGHPVVWRARVRRLTAPGCFVIGESGRLTHPATAEGIYQAMRSGMMAAAAIGDVFHRGVAERTAAERYDRGCVRAFQASFMAGLAFRAALRTPVLDWLVAAAHVPHVQRLTATVLARM
jgi:flavin-dependent dehydrogenase